MHIWLWYGVIAAMLLLFVPGRPIYMVVFLVAILHWGMGWAARRGFARISIERSTEPIYLFPGDHAAITTSITNHSFFPFGWIYGSDRVPLGFQKQNRPMSFPSENSLIPSLAEPNDDPHAAQKRQQNSLHRPEQGWVLSLAPKETASTSYDIRAVERGVHNIGPLQIFAGDPLGVHKHHRTDQAVQRVVVYPRTHPLRRLQLPARLPLGNFKPKQALHPDPARLKGVRPYEAGDPMRLIHWQATARTQQLQVRELERTAAMDAVVMLDFNEDAFSVHDFATISEISVETAASLCSYLADMKENFSLLSNAPTGSVPLSVGTGQLMRVLTALAGLQLAPQTDFADWLDTISSTLPWGASLLVILPEDSERVVQRCLQLQRRGFQVLLFLTGSSVIHPQLLAANSPIRTYRVRLVAGLKMEGGTQHGAHTSL